MSRKLVTAPSSARSAIKAAQENCNHEDYKFSALIVKKGKVISVGLNYQNKTHPMTKNIYKHITVHAELNAIIRTVNKDHLKKSTIVVYREDKFGRPAMARPCVTCQYFLYQYGIKKMIYTTDQGAWVEELVPEYNFDLFFKKCISIGEKYKGFYKDSKMEISIVNNFIQVKGSEGDVIFQSEGKNGANLIQRNPTYTVIFEHVMGKSI